MWDALHRRLGMLLNYVFLVDFAIFFHDFYDVIS